MKMMHGDSNFSQDQMNQAENIWKMLDDMATNNPKVHIFISVLNV